MTVLIAALVFASACIHPLWNVLIKGDHDRAASWWLFTVMLSLLGGTGSGRSASDDIDLFSETMLSISDPRRD